MMTMLIILGHGVLQTTIMWISQVHGERPTMNM